MPPPLLSPGNFIVDPIRDALPECAGWPPDHGRRVHCVVVCVPAPRRLVHLPGHSRVAARQLPPGLGAQGNPNSFCVDTPFAASPESPCADLFTRSSLVAVRRDYAAASGPARRGISFHARRAPHGVRSDRKHPPHASRRPDRPGSTATAGSCAVTRASAGAERMKIGMFGSSHLRRLSAMGRSAVAIGAPFRFMTDRTFFEPP